MPKVSFIIPTYNNQKTIRNCLESIFNQSFTDFEIIVVNDGSTDKTRAILETYKDRLTIIDKENGGAPSARNKGLENSMGEYVLFCDADIVFKKDALEKMVNVLSKNPDVSYVYSSFRHGWKKFKLNKFDAKKLQKLNYISTNSLIRRRDFPGWDESLKKFQDWDLWLTMLKSGHIGKWIPEVLFRAQTKDGLISSWLPSIAYKIPWFKNKNIEKYNTAKKIILRKHSLDKTD